jgi:hypothetical protein
MKLALLALTLVVASSALAQSATEASAGTWQLQYAAGLEALSKADAPTKKLIGNYDTVSIDSKTQALLKQFEPAIQSVREGVTADLHPTTPKVQDLNPVLKDLNNGRMLFNLMMLQVRAETEAGDDAGAAKDLVVAMALGRNIAREPILISTMVGIGTELRAIETLAKKLTTLPPDVRASLRKSIEAIPEPAKFADVVRGEQALAPQLLGKQMGAGAPEQIKKLSPFYDAVVKASEGPGGKFAETVQKEADASESPFPKTLAPTFIRQFNTHRRMEVERAMLMAAFDACDNGAESIQKTSDPAGEGPFKFEATNEGFKLSSALTDKQGKPVTLVVGE